VQAVEGAFQRIDFDRLDRTPAIADLLQQRFHRVRQIAHRGDADHARTALEGVQVALQTADAFAVVGRIAQRGHQAVAAVEQLAAFFGEQADEFRVEPGNVERAIGLRIVRECGQCRGCDVALRLRAGGGNAFGFGLLGRDALALCLFGCETLALCLFDGTTLLLGLLRSKTFLFGLFRRKALAFGLFGGKTFLLRLFSGNAFGLRLFGGSAFGFGSKALLLGLRRGHARLFGLFRGKAFLLGLFGRNAVLLGLFGRDAFGFGLLGRDAFLLGSFRRESFLFRLLGGNAFLFGLCRRHAFGFGLLGGDALPFRLFRRQPIGLFARSEGIGIVFGGQGGDGRQTDGRDALVGSILERQSSLGFEFEFRDRNARRTEWRGLGPAIA